MSTEEWKNVELYDLNKGDQVRFDYTMPTLDAKAGGELVGIDRWYVNVRPVSGEGDSDFYRRKFITNPQRLEEVRPVPTAPVILVDGNPWLRGSYGSYYSAYGPSHTWPCTDLTVDWQEAVVIPVEPDEAALDAMRDAVLTGHLGLAGVMSQMRDAYAAIVKQAQR